MQFQWDRAQKRPKGEYWTNVFASMTRFKYLGSAIESDRDIIKDITH